MLTRALPDDLFDVVMVGFNLVNPSARARVWATIARRDADRQGAASSGSRVIPRSAA